MSLLARLGSKTIRISVTRGALKEFQSGAVTGPSALKHTGSAQEQIDAFFKKNKSLNRPMTPHMTIYNFKLPPLLSGTHRATGLAMAGILGGLGSIGTVCDFNTIITSLQSLQGTLTGDLLTLSVKFCVFFPLFYHSFNGMRHLVWDAGYGFKINEMYASGYFVLAITLICTSLVLFSQPLRREKK